MLNEAIYKIKGVGALMMHNVQLANPMNHWTKELKKLTSNRKKTDETNEEVSRIEFMGGLYWKDPNFIIPGGNIESALVEAAKKSKLGKTFKSGVFVYDDAILSFDGPKTPEGRWETGACHDFRPVVVGKARIMRTRPIFMGWSATIKVMFDPEQVDRSQIDSALAILGRVIGIGDNRPRFGRFEVVS
jgi:hypothetical protein